MSAFANRLRKNVRHRLRWAARQKLTAFRVYDLDMPEVPVAVDVYAGHAHVMEYPRRQHRRGEALQELRAEVLAAVSDVLGIPPARVFAKTHEPKAWGNEQYHRQGAAAATVEVEENGLRFEANLSDYLDTGLFLDHRNTRALVRKRAQGKRFLNLFAYTGSFTVAALAGGAAETTTVDLSATYCAWAARNFSLNGFAEGPRHRLVRADVLSWLEGARGPFDLVVLDPPSFSTSKRMNGSFDVQRDHLAVVSQVRALLAPAGELYFSTNYLDFEMDAALQSQSEELTPRSIPEDFRREVHRCWRFGYA